MASGNLGAALHTAMRQGMSEEEARRIALLNGIQMGPSGTVTARYGNEAGATFEASPTSTAGLRAGAVVQDGAGKQWMVDDSYQWTPYTGAGQWQNVSGIDDARQKLVQDWYNTGRDPANTEAAAMEAYLKDAGRLGARMPRAGGPITKENIGALKAGLDAGGGTPSGTSSLSGRAWGGGGGTPYEQYLNGFQYGPAPTYGGSPYDNRRDELISSLENSKFSFDPAKDPAWQAYQKQYRREGQRATEDTLGRMAGMTGGVPSSYAATAASQAGNYYAAQLADKIPQIYNDAYNRYLAQYEQQLGVADRYNQYGQQDYNRFRDELGQYNTDRSFTYGVYSDDYSRARQDMLDQYGVEQDAKQWAWNEEAREYQRTQDELDRAERAAATEYNREQDALNRERQNWLDQYGVEQDALNRETYLQEYEDAQLQQEWDNAYKLVQNVYGGVVPEGWIADVLGIPAGSHLPAASVYGGSGGGDLATTGGNVYERMYQDGVRTKWDAYAWLLTNGSKEERSAANQLSEYYGNWIGQLGGQVGGGNGTGQGKTTSLDYDEDEGIFTWNGKKYSDMGKLAADINEAGLSDEELAILSEKLKRYGFEVTETKSSGSGGR